MKEQKQLLKIKPIKGFLFFYYPMVIILIYVVSFIICIFTYEFTEISLDYLVVKNTFHKYKFTYNYLFIVMLISLTYSIRDSFFTHQFTNEEYITFFAKKIVAKKTPIKLHKIIFRTKVSNGNYNIQIFYDYQGGIYSPLYDVNYSDFINICRFGELNNIPMWNNNGDKIEDENYFAKS